VADDPCAGYSFKPLAVTEFSVPLPRAGKEDYPIFNIERFVIGDENRDGIHDVSGASCGAA